MHCCSMFRASSTRVENYVDSAQMHVLSICNLQPYSWACKVLQHSMEALRTLECVSHVMSHTIVSWQKYLSMLAVMWTGNPYMAKCSSNVTA